ncbi:MAG TPA: hypothetical protein VLH60_02250 [Sedimentisphaerales bacterium]|nr:hypothetical protein [Sedimentisphaerales bacterium]
MDVVKALESLVKTLEAGNYNVAPSQLTQGGALQIEDLSPVMHNVCFDDSHIKLQKLFAVKKARTLLVQFNRQLSYGRFGGSAQREGAVGDVRVGDYVRVTVPMCFYSAIRRVTVAANMMETFDGQKAEDREANNEAINLAADVEFDLFKGKADFSNAGVFDGNPLAMPELPSMLGVDSQIRQSDILVTTQDLMFASYGSNQSVVLFQDGALDQLIIEDASLRSRMNHGKADRLYVDPVILTGYNKKVALGTGANMMQRIVLAGSAQDASGADLRRQWVSGNTVSIEDSRFLSGKTSPLRPTIGSPAAPVVSVAPAAGSSGSNLKAQTGVIYLVTAESERGEGLAVQAGPAINILLGEIVTFTIAPQAGVTHFNVYRGTSVASAKFIGRVAATGGSVVFTDLGNKAPGFVTGYLIQSDTWAMHELAPYSRMKLAITDLSVPEAHFRFATLAGMQPRKNVLVDNLY